jgi:hypothetical protein
VHASMQGDFLSLLPAGRCRSGSELTPCTREIPSRSRPGVALDIPEAHQSRAANHGISRGPARDWPVKGMCEFGCPIPHSIIERGVRGRRSTSTHPPGDGRVDHRAFPVPKARLLAGDLSSLSNDPAITILDRCFTARAIQ